MKQKTMSKLSLKERLKASGMKRPPLHLMVLNRIRLATEWSKVKASLLLYKILRVDPKPHHGQFAHSYSSNGNTIRVLLTENREWHKYLRENKPIRYFILATFPRIIRDYRNYIHIKLSDFYGFYENAFIIKTHIKKTGVKFGDYVDKHDMLMKINFSVIVDLVEIKYAEYFLDHSRREELMSMGFDFDKLVKERKWTTIKHKQWRNRELGLAYLHDLIKSSVHSNSATYKYETVDHHIETLVLYTWWTKIRPLRKDPYEASGEQYYHEQLAVVYGEDFYRKITTKIKDKFDELDNLTDQIAIDQETEDSEMFVRLASQLNTTFNQEY